MALNHDNDGFLLGERANLDEQLNILKSIKDDIHDIRASLHGVTTTPVQASVVESNQSTAIPRQAPSSTSSVNDRVLLASLESSAQSLSAVKLIYPQWQAHCRVWQKELQQRLLNRQYQ